MRSPPARAPRHPAQAPTVESEHRGRPWLTRTAPCPHEDFVVVAEINRIATTIGGPIEAYSADIRVSCAQCDEPFRWIGAPAGLQPHRPCVNVDETELHAPLRPASSDPDFGLSIPGLAVLWHEGGR